MLDKNDEDTRDELGHSQLTSRLIATDISGLARVMALLNADAARDAMALLESTAGERPLSDDEVLRCLRNLREVLAEQMSPSACLGPAPQDLDAAIRYFGARIDETLSSF